MEDWTGTDSGLAVRIAELEADNSSLRDRIAQLESALAEARRMAESLRRDAVVLSHMTEAIVVTDLNGIVTYWNFGATRVFGWTEAERVGRPVLDMYEAPAVRSWAAVRLRRALTGEECVGEMQDYRKDGSTVWLACHVQRLLGPTGQPIGLIRVSQEITGRKLTEQALRAQVDRYRMVCELTSDLAFQLRIDADGSEGVDWLAGRLVEAGGYAAEEIHALGGWQSLCHPDDLPTAREMLLRLRSGQPATGEIRFGCRSGDYRWLRLTSRPIRDPANQHIRGVVGAGRDVTDENDAEKERQQRDHVERQTEKLDGIGTLAGGIAHDFNNLLTVILGNASLLAPVLTAGSPERSSAERISESARRAADLCAQLLAYAGKGRVVLEQLDLNQLIHEATPQMAFAANEKAELRLEPAENLPSIEADSAQIRQALLNLVTNGIEAVDRIGGRVLVRTGTVHVDRTLLMACQAGDRLAEGEHVFLDVADTGPGMTAEATMKIFEPYFSTKAAGRGLGLAAVHGIVRSHHGGIHVTTVPHGGTTVRLLFPKRRATAEQTQGGQTASAPNGAILVIEDEDGIRELDRMVFERAGFRVFTARDGPEGIDIFRRHFYDIRAVLLDLTMPGANGRQVAAELHAVRPSIPVVLTSGFTGDEALSRADQTNIAAFLQKPYTPAGLLEKMKRVLGIERAGEPPAQAGG